MVLANQKKDFLCQTFGFQKQQKLKMKNLLFKFGWIVPIATFVLFILDHFLFDIIDFQVAMSAVGGSLAFYYFVQQQKLAETILLKDLFSEFVGRYDTMNERLAKISSQKGFSNTDQCKSDLQVAVDYFNLCAEEYLYYEMGYIPKKIWASWCRGMLFYLDTETFTSLWKSEIDSNSYYGISIEKIRKGAETLKTAKGTVCL